MNARQPFPPYDAPEPVVRLAGAWLARRDHGFTAEEAAEFDCWVRAHPSHAAAVAQLDRTMSTFDRLRELAPPAGVAPDRDYFAPPRTIRRWLPVAVTGLAAALAVIVWTGRDAPSPTHWRYATLAGGYDRAILIDGSIVELNTDTSVEIDYTRRERRVRLTRGEAHFQVAKDPSRPFIVQANAVSVSAVGTAFNVRLATAGVEVLVTEGRVRVAPPSPPPARASHVIPAEPVAEIPLLTAGQKVVVSTTAIAEPARIDEVSRDEMQRALAWQMRVAEFSKTPLSAIVADFNRQNQLHIVIHDPELGALRIGGNFRLDQPDAFVRLLENGFGVQVERSGQVITLRKAPPESP
jgi:transmembrane sensor